MSISVRIRNKLLADSGGICSICHKDLILYHGEICHIEAQSPGGARYNSFSSAEQRDSYDNLIYLCSICHKDIDINQKDSYTVEKLKHIKYSHINKIQNTFKCTTYDYSDYYNKTLSYMHSTYFTQWASNFVSGFTIAPNIYDDIINYKKYVDIYQLANDNHLNELRINISSLIEKLSAYSSLILCEWGSKLVGNNFYKRYNFNPNYYSDLEFYKLIKGKIQSIFLSLVININALLFHLELKINDSPFLHKEKLKFMFSESNFSLDNGYFIETENYKDLLDSLSILKDFEVETYIEENYPYGIDW